MTRYRWLLVSLGVALGMGTLLGCEEGLFKVKNPGRILDEDLNTDRALNAVVVGMSADFSVVFDDIAFIVARLSDEMEASGSYFLSTRARHGIIDYRDTDAYWEGIQRARFVAEDGLRRMQKVLGDAFNGDPRVARAYLFAGLANRVLGENFCRVVFDGGPDQPKEAAFERAVQFFTEAINQAQQAGTDDILLAAYGGRAQAYMGLGDWSKAVADAQRVPTDFVYYAIYSDNSTREYNVIFLETHQRHEMSAYQTLAHRVAMERGSPDPRAPFTDCREGDCPNAQGADGSTPHLRQEKYADRGADIPVVKGTEMRLIEAEAALRNGDLATALAKINEVRTFYGLDPIDPATVSGIGDLRNADENDGWSILDRERHLTLWLEGRRLWDLHRWNHPFLEGGTIVYPGVNPRASCLPISQSECQTNPNIDQTQNCQPFAAGG
ncbi:RagB/SusD family nutrient uptake outer membrane protein [Rhodothermus profundi]|uniref:SusD family protein n=1 Tax=Rhodothermus profundi TaxID=633813 RepID=A0A1M6SXP4_9BACT|nr:RagB/SusD family nutrient uptake outer membrane protein [Rhodothermus profundi]SHK49495.1 SusD family protein [Rhodothermus profundi]